jgi:hypothetical protein
MNRKLLKSPQALLEKQMAEWVAGKMKPGGSFQGVKLRPANPPKYAGGNKDVIKDWLATMVQWLGSSSCVPEHRGCPCPDLFDRRSSQPLES